MDKSKKCQKVVFYHNTAIQSDWGELECLSWTKNTFFLFLGSFFTKMALSQEKFKRELVLHF